jgi:hypothetical protein
MGFRQSLLPHRRGTAALAGLSAVVIAGTSLAFGAGPASAVPGTGQGDAAGHFSSQVLASNGDNAIDPVLGKYYRIVALANLGGGQLLAAYDGRPTGGDAPAANSIIQRRSTDGGKTWGEPTYIARGQVAAQGVQKYGFSDPSYVVDRETGMVFNFHVYSKDAGFASSKLGNDDADRNIISAEVSVSTDVVHRSRQSAHASGPGLLRPGVPVRRLRRSAHHGDRQAHRRQRQRDRQCRRCRGRIRLLRRRNPAPVRAPQGPPHPAVRRNDHSA